jgi:hypothetical protein
LPPSQSRNVMRLTPSCVAVFLSLCFDSFEYRPDACKTSSVVIGVVRIFAKCQRIVYFFANIPRFRVRVAHDEGRKSKRAGRRLKCSIFLCPRWRNCIAISIIAVFTADIRTQVIFLCQIGLPRERIQPSHREQQPNNQSGLI